MEAQPVSTRKFSKIQSDTNPLRFVIPGLTEPAPYLIRGNPVVSWIRAFAGMTCFVTCFVVINDAMDNKNDRDFIRISPPYGHV